MRLLVTRPDEDGQALARILEARGYEVLLAPLFTIRFIDQVELSSPARYHALLATSANGVRAITRRCETQWLRLPLFAVGDATAHTAREAGFVQVSHAEGDVESLAELVRASVAPSDGPLLHIAGSVLAGDLKGMLEARGFEVDRVALYETVAASDLAEQAAFAIAQRRLDGALFYSPRTARIFAGLIERAGLQSSLSTITAYCLSPAVADSLGDLPFAGKFTAGTPTQDSLLRLLEN